MIEISHTQARRMIREGLDRRLPDVQWAALQAHLEACAECRAYRDRYSRLEKGLRRTLRHRWSAVRGPQGDQMRAIEGRREARQQRQVWLKRVGMGLGVFFLFFLYISYQRLTAPGLAQEPTRPPTAQVTRTPTPPRLTFNGVVAYASLAGGSYDVRLINAQEESTAGQSGVTGVNMTTSSFNETYPVWSPDGEWLAFLSDRPGLTADEPSANRKTELYVMHVAGSRLTQLTDSPEVIWQGPLSWSADGKLIALSGVRRPAYTLGLLENTRLAGIPPAEQAAAVQALAASEERWVYLVPVDGTGPYSLPFSRASSGAVLFSPGNPFLAYATSQNQGGLLAHHTGSGNSVQIISENPNMLPGAAAGTFGWSLGGQSLVYLFENRNRSDVRLSGEMDSRFFTGRVVYAPAGQPIETSPGPGRYRSVSWVPEQLLVAILQDEDGDGCWVVRLRNPYRPTQEPYDMNGLCVDGVLGPGNFTPDGRWVVVRAHPPRQPAGGRRVSFYALRIPEDLFEMGAGELYYEKLIDIDVPGGQGSEPVIPEPVVRPAGRGLSIMPRAVRPAAPLPAPSIPPAGTPGTLIYTRLTDPRLNSQASSSLFDPTRLIRIQPDFSGAAVLTEAAHPASCPARSPEGNRLAFVANGPGAQPEGTELYLMNPEGGEVTRLTGTGLTVAPRPRRAGTAPRYDCPVWSPDGRFLAAVMRYPSEQGQPEAYLAVLGMQEGATLTTPDGRELAYRYLPVTPPSLKSLPRWMPDGQHLLLVYPSSASAARASTRLVMIDPALAETEGGAGYDIVLSLSGWTDVNGLEFSPDGQYFAMVVYTFNSNTHDSRAQLRVLRADSWETVSAPILAGFDYASTGGPGTLAWLEDGRIAIVRHTSLAGPTRAAIDVYDPATLRTRTLFQNEDVIINAVWSPDQRWLAYSSESGLWMLDFGSLLAGQPVSPLLVDDGRITHLEWK